MTQNPTALEISLAKDVKRLESQIIIALTRLSPEHDGSDKDCKICKAITGLEEVLND